MNPQRTVLIVSADTARCSLIQANLSALGWIGTTSSSASAFVNVAQRYPDAACMFVDDQVDAHTNGLQMLRLVAENDIEIPLILMVESPSAEFVVEALQLGAAAILRRPINRAGIEQGIACALEFRKIINHRKNVEEHSRRMNRLSEREKQILQLAVDGWPNKRIASHLSVSVKTIERDRRQAYDKLCVRSSAEMARVVTLGSLLEFVGSAPLAQACQPAFAVIPNVTLRASG